MIIGVDIANGAKPFIISGREQDSTHRECADQGKAIAVLLYDNLPAITLNVMAEELKKIRAADVIDKRAEAKSAGREAIERWSIK